MSKGLGKVERLVLEALKGQDSHRVLSVGDLAYMVHWGIDCFQTSDGPPSSPPYAVYQSVCRAVRSLERKGLIKWKKRNAYPDRRHYGKRGGSSWSKVIELISV